MLDSIFLVKVISLDLRTALVDGEGVFAQEGFKGEGAGKEEEIDYCTVLNRSILTIFLLLLFCWWNIWKLGIFHLKFASLDGPQLPDWTTLPGAKQLKPTTFQFNSFSQIWLQQSHLPLLLSKSISLLGSHAVGWSEDDWGTWFQVGNLLFRCNWFCNLSPFRNFCKMDVNNGVVKFTRRVDSISVDCVLQEGEEEGPFDICRIKITAKAFLWHQVSCSLALCRW